MLGNFFVESMLTAKTRRVCGDLEVLIRIWMGKGEREDEKEKLVCGDEHGFGESRKVEESSIVVGSWKVN